MFSIQCHIDLTLYDHNAAHFTFFRIYIYIYVCSFCSMEVYFVIISLFISEGFFSYFGSVDSLCYLIVTLSGSSILLYSLSIRTNLNSKKVGWAG